MLEFRDNQFGRLLAETVSRSPSGSEMVGWNRQDWPTVTDDGGVPEIDGGELLPGGSVPPADRSSLPRQAARKTLATTGKNLRLLAYLKFIRTPSGG
ncbi:hypothetical protein G6N75_09160 [Thioalkalivibrio sp. XN8]|nr:hypothetical protein [Thioalkalivibrio sp. XN8]